MKKDEILAIIALSRIKGIPNYKKKEILEHYERVSTIFEDPSQIEEPFRKTLSSFREWERIDKETERLKRMDVEILTIKDERYPYQLKAIPDPPIVLYKKGPLEIKDRTLAIVGTRRATEKGKNLAEKISSVLSSLSITIVSGLARGIDAYAHMGALKGEGKTIAVLGCGIDICYPSENFNLFKKIENEGLLLTEYPPSSKPLPFHFPERNRIIAGISMGVLVIEASIKSGSLITARFGIEYGREVMAIPGSIFDESYKGANLLIKEGARLVDSIEDILLTVFPDVKWDKKKVEMTEREEHIYNLIPAEGIHVEEIIEKSRFQAKEVMAILTNLTMKDLVKETVGGFFMRR